MADGLFPEPALSGPAPVGLGRAMAGGGAKVDRQGNDYYPTPAGVTRALLAAERDALVSACDAQHPVWEPCGRGGAIMAVLEHAGFPTIGTDIVADPAHRVTQLDLLLARRAMSPVAITNPPFTLAAPMIRHLLGELRCHYVAMLLKGTFWHAAERTGLFRRHMPQRIHALNWRPDFLGKNNPAMEVIWTVWDADAVDQDKCVYGIVGQASDGGLLDFEGEAPT